MHEKFYFYFRRVPKKKYEISLCKYRQIKNLRDSGGGAPRKILPKSMKIRGSSASLHHGGSCVGKYCKHVFFLKRHFAPPSRLRRLRYFQKAAPSWRQAACSDPKIFNRKNRVRYARCKKEKRNKVYPSWLHFESNVSDFQLSLPIQMNNVKDSFARSFTLIFWHGTWRGNLVSFEPE